MSKTLELWLIRHAQSMANLGVWSNKPAEVNLTEKGLEDAIKTAEKVLVAPDLIVVSPFQRSQQSAIPLISRWPESPVEMWPIHEFVYLSPEKCWDKPAEERRVLIENYWRRLDPFYSDGPGAETFALFIERLKAFHQHVLAQSGFLVVIGHGEFFRAFQQGLEQGFAATASWMQEFRQRETCNPMANGEIIKILFGSRSARSPS